MKIASVMRYLPRKPYNVQCHSIVYRSKTKQIESHKMVLATNLSLVISFLSAILVFSLMQFLKQFFLSSQLLTIFAGVTGSSFFILLLTTISNLEALINGKNFQAKWFPEVFVCLLAACFACSTIHRVAVTTCILSSFIGLYYVNQISQKFHSTSVAAVDTAMSKKKKK